MFLVFYHQQRISDGDGECCVDAGPLQPVGCVVVVVCSLLAHNPSFLRIRVCLPSSTAVCMNVYI